MWIVPPLAGTACAALVLLLPGDAQAPIPIAAPGARWWLVPACTLAVLLLVHVLRELGQIQTGSC